MSDETTNDFFDKMKTPEGQKELLEAFQQWLESDPTTAEAIVAGIVQAIDCASQAGRRMLQHPNETVSFLEVMQRISTMSEEEARAYIEAMLGEDGNATAKELIRKIDFKKPMNYVYPTLKATMESFRKDKFTDDGTLALGVDVSPRKSPSKAIVTIDMVIAVDESDTRIQKYLTPYDRQVMNGVFTLYANGIYNFTSKQVYEAFAGKSTTSKQAIGHVTRSIEKMRRTFIDIDWTEHLKMNGTKSKGDDSFVTNENLLSLTGCKFRCNGQVLEGYVFDKTPPLYRYAKAVGQLSTVDRRLLAVPISNTEDTILLKNYLLERIQSMKHGKVSHNIKFETLYKLMGADNDVKHWRVRDKVETILSYWSPASKKGKTETPKGQGAKTSKRVQEKKNPEVVDGKSAFIKGYRLNSSNRGIESVTILL